MFDALTFETRTFNITRNENNPVNGKNPTITKLIDYEEFCGMKAVEKPIKEISIEEFDEWKTNGENIQVIDVREPSEYAEVNIGATLIPLNFCT